MLYEVITYIALFPVPSELSYNDFKQLLSIHELLIEHGVDYIELVFGLEDQIAQLNIDDSIPEDELKNKILLLIKQKATELAKLPKRDRITSYNVCYTKLLRSWFPCLSA